MLVEEKNSLTQEIESLVETHGKGRNALLTVLHEIQLKHRFISEFAQQEIARLLDIHPVEVYSVVTFFSFINEKPKGKNIIRVCQTISCDMKNKSTIVSAIERELGIKVGEMTKDRKFTLEYANCLGLCDKGPAMAVNERIYTQLTPQKAVEIINQMK